MLAPVIPFHGDFSGEPTLYTQVGVPETYSISSLPLLYLSLASWSPVRSAGAAYWSRCSSRQYALKRPNAINFSRKNDIHPFEDASSLEFFAGKNDASLFITGLHSKKRPNDLVMSRIFDGRILDQFELGVEEIREMGSYPVSETMMLSHPCLLSPDCHSKSASMTLCVHICDSPFSPLTHSFPQSHLEPCALQY
jgi:hypothetical protein